MTQNEILLKYLQEHEEGITAREALLNLGIGRLASRICDLRREKYPISSTSEKVTTRYGSTYVSRYRLKIETCDNCKYSSRVKDDKGRFFCDYMKAKFYDTMKCMCYEKGDNV